jgi:hypothetical protein
VHTRDHEVAVHQLTIEVEDDVIHPDLAARAVDRSEPDHDLLVEVDARRLAVQTRLPPQGLVLLGGGGDAGAVRVAGPVGAEEAPPLPCLRLRPGADHVLGLHAGDAEPWSGEGGERGQTLLDQLADPDLDQAGVDAVAPTGLEPGGGHGTEGLVPQRDQLGLGPLDRDRDHADARELILELGLARLGPFAERHRDPAVVVPIDPDVLEARLPGGPGPDLLHRHLVREVDRLVPVPVLRSGHEGHLRRAALQAERQLAPSGRRPGGLGRGCRRLRDPPVAAHRLVVVTAGGEDQRKHHDRAQPEQHHTSVTSGPRCWFPPLVTAVTRAVTSDPWPIMPKVSTPPTSTRGRPRSPRSGAPRSRS